MNIYEQTEHHLEGSDHEVTIMNRKEIEIKGVKEVDSFDHEEFLLETTMGYLVLRGRGLQLKNLHVEEGVVQIEGKINEMLYVDEQTEEIAKGFFSKLFR